MQRSYDRDILQEVSDHYPEMIPPHIVDPWIENPHNVMYVEGRSVGLATFEYKGVYSVHWFYTDEHRGRKALDLARQMIDALFTDTDAQIIRGITKSSLKGARWACRQLGYTSHGLMDFTSGEHELFTMTKDQFYNKHKKDT